MRSELVVAVLVLARGVSSLYVTSPRPYLQPYPAHHPNLHPYHSKPRDLQPYHPQSRDLQPYHTQAYSPQPRDLQPYSPQHHRDLQPYSPQPRDLQVIKSLPMFYGLPQFRPEEYQQQTTPRPALSFGGVSPRPQQPVGVAPLQPFVYHGPTSPTASPRLYQELPPAPAPASPVYLSVTTPTPSFSPSPRYGVSPAPAPSPAPRQYRGWALSSGRDHSSFSPSLVLQRDSDLQTVSSQPVQEEPAPAPASLRYPAVSPPPAPKLHLVPAKPAISFIDPPAPIIAPSPAPTQAPSPPTLAPAPAVPLVLNPNFLHKSRERAFAARPGTSPAPTGGAAAAVTSAGVQIDSAVVQQRQSAVLQRQRARHRQHGAGRHTGRQAKSLKTVSPSRNSLPASPDPGTKLHPRQPPSSGQPASTGRSAALLKLMEIAGADWGPPVSGAGPRAGAVFSCPRAEGHYPAPGSCSVYYQCAQATAHRRECGPGLSWSVDTESCDWADNVSCSAGTRP